MSYVHAPTKTFLAGAALVRYLRVKITAGLLQVAESADVELGVLANRTLASGEPVAVHLRTAEGSTPMVAAQAITAFAPVFAASGGKVAASGTILLGIAMTAAMADNDEIEVLRRGETSDSAAAGGTTATAFLVDSDAATPKIELAGQTAGTGDFKTTLKPESTLSANNTIIVPEANGDTLAAVALAQTLTNKTLTAPVISNPVVTDAPGASTAAAGTTTADAGVLPSHTSRVYPTTAADDTKGVRVAATDKVTGTMLFIGNGVANKILKVYGPSGATINGAAADAAFSSVSGKGVILYCLDSTANTWLAW